MVYKLVSNVTSALPPPVDAQIWGPCKPRVQYVDAAQGVWSLDGVLQGWVIVQAQSLPEPVDGVDNHVACFLYAGCAVTYKTKIRESCCLVKEKNRKKESESACLGLSLVRDHIHRWDSPEQTGLRMWMVAETSWRKKQQPCYLRLR